MKLPLVPLVQTGAGRPEVEWWRGGSGSAPLCLVKARWPENGAGSSAAAGPEECSSSLLLSFTGRSLV